MVNDNETEIRPAKGSHAIEAAAFGIEWLTPLEQAQLEELGTLIEASPVLSALLPNKKSLSAIAVKLQNDAPGELSLQPNSAMDFSGSDAGNEGGLTASIRPEFVSCTTTNYSRWKTSKSQLLSVLMPVVHSALNNNGVGIQAIGLQYIDAFRWKKSGGNLVANILRNDGELIPKRLFQASSFWHVHQGWFSETADGKRVLNNVNVDVLEDGDDYLLRIQGNHRVQSVRFSNNSFLGPLHPDDIEPCLDHLHQINKRVLNGMLTTDMLSLIGLRMENA